MSVTDFDGPFLGTEALAAGTVSRRGLNSRHRAIYRNVYLARGEELTALARAKAAWLWSERRGTLAGLSGSGATRVAVDRRQRARGTVPPKRQAGRGHCHSSR